MNKRETILAALCGLFLGVIVGFLIAPIKKGWDIGNNAGNTTNYYGKDWEQEKQQE